MLSLIRDKLIANYSREMVNKGIFFVSWHLSMKKNLILIRKLLRNKFINNPEYPSGFFYIRIEMDRFAADEI